MLDHHKHSEIYRLDLRLRIVGVHGILLNAVLLSSLVPRLFDQIRIFTLFDFVVEIQGLLYMHEIQFFHLNVAFGPSLANAFLSHYERTWLDDCPVEFKPVFYRRYVDDVFVLFSSPNHLPLFKDYLNSKHNNISFTSEQEHNDSLPFLDVNVVRQELQFSTSVYKKPTFSGVYTNFKSFLPIEYKHG